MKKAISVFLCVLLIFLSCSAAVQGIGKNSDISEYPVVIVPGYSASTLVKINDDGTQETVWGVDWNAVLDRVFARIVELGIGLGALTVGNAHYIADVIGPEMTTMLDGMRCNPDGSSVYNVVRKFPTAEETNRANLFEVYPDGSYQFEPDIMAEVTQYIPAESIYNFNCDFRMGAVFCATQLDEYIQQVKALSGKDRVNIFAISHGGQVTGTYLTLFGHKRDVKNAVMTVPALGGAGLVYDLLSDKPYLDELNLLHFIEHGMTWETDYHWLVEAQELGFLDEVIRNLIPYLLEVAGYWGSAWDFCPTEVYEKNKSKLLDPVKSALLIEKSDYMHYEVMPRYSEAFEKCESEYGMNISIISGTDNSCTSGWQENSDGIISTKASTGATCAPYGSRFADGYTQVNPCGGKYKVSPAMTVDASTAYMPDDTWFVEGLFHGMTYWDYFTRDLMITLLLTDEIEDVYSNTAYPQFHATSNPSEAVWAAFNNSTEGYLSSQDTELVIKNLSWEGFDTSILAITCDGVALAFDLPRGCKIAAGESISIPFTGAVPQKSLEKVSVTISYCVSGSGTPIGERTMSFTLMNGEAAQYSADTPYVSADAVMPIDSLVSGGFAAVLKQLGLYKLFSMFYTLFYNAAKTVSAFISTVI